MCNTVPRNESHSRHIFDELQAGIWIDQNGCHHWIIDDGVEGYMNARRYPDGRPVCDPSAVRNSVGGTFKAGGTSLLGDPI